MRKTTIMMLVLWVFGTLSAADVARLALDCRDGVKIVEGAEFISYSPNWATEESGAESVVTINRKEVVRSTEAGDYEWIPDHRMGPQTLTHRVKLNGETVGEVYKISFYEALDIAESLGERVSNVETSDDSIFSVIPGEVVMPIDVDKSLSFDVDGEAVLSFEAEIDFPESESNSGYSWAQLPMCVTLDGVDVTDMGNGVVCPGNSNVVGERYPEGWYSSDEVPEKYVWKFYLKPGPHHVSIGYSYASLSGASSADLRIKNFKVKPVEESKDLYDFGKLVYEYRIWRPESLKHLRDNVYGARIAANDEDYEARVMCAITKLLILCENETVRQVLADFGFSIEDYTFALAGKFVGLESAPLPNETIDRIAPEILAGLDDALSDLKAIPDNWNGCIVLDSNVYTFIPESFVIDLAEISVFRALVEAARASVLLAKGYDFTMDYVAVSNAVVTADYIQEVMAAAPQAGYVRDAQALLESKEWFRTALNHIRRADQVVLWRTSPVLHLIEYDRADEADIGRARLYLSHLIGSLDHPETIDLPYFVDRFGGVDETLSGGMFRQIYLGALFAGRVTRDVVPEVMIRPTTLYMDTVEDVTIGGLLPDLSFGEFADLYPLNQYWTMDLYRAIQPRTRLAHGQLLTVEGEAACDGTFEYTAYGTGLKSVSVTCSVADELIDEHTFAADKSDGLDQMSFESCVQVSAGELYTLTCFAAPNSMNRRLTLFDILTIPETSPYVDGNYTETIDGITWLFTVENGEATITGVQGTVSGDIVVPTKLGGRPVTAIAEQVFALKSQIASVVIPSTVASIGKYAFMACENLTSIRFEGDSPEVGTLAFTGVASTAKVVFTEGAIVSGATNGLWQGLTVEYATVEKTDYLRVRASLPDGYSFTGTATLSLAADADATIYFTMNGEDPTAKALVYSSPISVASTTCIKYFAIDNNTGTLGPVGTTVLKLVAPEIELLEAEPYVKNVNGITWSYLKRADGVCLSGTAGFASGKPLTGVVELPTYIDWLPVVSVGAGLFSGCDQLTGVVVPQGITTIEREAFRGCTRLENIELPEGLLSIGDGAFRECSSIKSITLPSTVTNVGYFAFRDCLRLEEIELKGDAPRQDLGVCIGVPAFTVISGRLGSATAIVYASVTNKTDEITVPMGWLDEIAVAHGTPAGFESYQAAFEAKFGADLAAALKKPTGKHDLMGNPLHVWQDYVAGTDPLDEEDQFTATVVMENGIPVVRWSPELSPERAALRKYTTYGATALNGVWVDVSGLSDEARRAAGYQFFKVTVEMK